MKSIYNANDNQELVNRLMQLTETTQPIWGKMTVDQMLKHCQAPIDVAFGTLQLKSNLMFLLLGKIFKNIILKKEFKKNSATAPDFIFTSSYNFESTRQELIKKIEEFASQGSKVIKNKKHPFFGTMTSEEWDILQYKHIDHHLKQFGK